MAAKNNNALFYTCSLIEYIGRTKKETRCKIVEDLGKDTIQRIYNYSDVFHCEPIEKVAMEFIEEYRMEITIMLEVADTKCQITGILEKCMSD